MQTIIRQHPLAFVLALIAAVLVGVIAVEAGVGGARLWSPPPAAAPKPAASVETKVLPPLASVNPDQAYPESAARPPFIPTRRPAPPAQVAANTMVRGQFTLQGVIGLGEKRIALLREKSNGRMHRVEKGKEINGLTLAAIDNDKVTLAQGGEQEQLVLQVQKGPAVAAVAPPPAAPGAPAAGPFAPAAPPPVAAAPVPAKPAAPVAAAPVPQPGAPVANPAARTGFGPHPPQGAEQAATPLTPEELLARRRARRAQQEGNPR